MRCQRAPHRRPDRSWRPGKASFWAASQPALAQQRAEREEAREERAHTLQAARGAMSLSVLSALCSPSASTSLSNRERKKPERTPSNLERWEREDPSWATSTSCRPALFSVPPHLDVQASTPLDTTACTHCCRPAAAAAPPPPPGASASSASRPQAGPPPAAEEGSTCAARAANRRAERRALVIRPDSGPTPCSQTLAQALSHAATRLPEHVVVEVQARERRGLHARCRRHVRLQGGEAERRSEVDACARTSLTRQRRWARAKGAGG